MASLKSPTVLVMVTTIGLLFLTRPTFGHGDHGQETARKLEALKSKFDVDNVIRSPSHIKEDLKDLIDLAGNETISEDQSYFYLIRMHDFDNNDGLDGLELYTALVHIYEHHGENVTVDGIEDYMSKEVDRMLEVDVNADGILTYAEYKRGAADKTK